MTHLIKRNKITVPTDDAEFEQAVISALKAMVSDGSHCVSHMDVCYYNRWVRTGNTSRRIAAVFRDKLNMGKVTPRCYKIPEDMNA